MLWNHAGGRGLQGDTYRGLRLLLCPRSEPRRGAQTPRLTRGKRGGRGRPVSELARLQRRFEDLADKVLSDDAEQRVDKGVAAVAGQLLNGARACVRDALSAREQEELLERLEVLEEALESKKGGGRWGA